MRVRQGSAFASKVQPLSRNSMAPATDVPTAPDPGRDLAGPRQVPFDFQSFCDHAGAPSYLADAQARLVYANPAACTQLGYGEDELLRLGVPDIDLGSDPVRFTALLKRARQQPVPPFETALRRKN